MVTSAFSSGGISNLVGSVSEEEYKEIKGYLKEIAERAKNKEIAKLSSLPHEELERHFIEKSKLNIKDIKEMYSVYEIEKEYKNDYASFQNFVLQVLDANKKDIEEDVGEDSFDEGFFDGEENKMEEVISDEDFFDTFEEFTFLKPEKDELALSWSIKEKELAYFESQHSVETMLDEEEEKSKQFKKEISELNQLIVDLIMFGASAAEISELMERKKKLEEVATNAHMKAVKKVKHSMEMQTYEVRKLITNTLRNLKGDEKKAFKKFLKEGGMTTLTRSPSVAEAKKVIVSFVKELKQNTSKIKVKNNKIDQLIDKKQSNKIVQAKKKEVVQDKKSTLLDKLKYDKIKQETKKAIEEDKAKEKKTSENKEQKTDKDKHTEKELKSKKTEQDHQAKEREREERKQKERNYYGL